MKKRKEGEKEGRREKGRKEGKNLVYRNPPYKISFMLIVSLYLTKTKKNVLPFSLC